MLLFFVTLGQPWLASIQSSWRGRSEITTRGLLLLRAVPLLPHVIRWEVPAVVATFLLPHVCKRWEALAVAAPLLLPRVCRMLHRTTRWRCGWWLLLLYACRWLLLLLQHAWWLLLLLRRHVWRSHPMTPPRTPRATTTNAPTSKRWAHMNCFLSIV
jgi:hypothetical protein